MREINQSIHIGETGNEGKPRPQPLQHEDMNQPFQTVYCTPTKPHTPHIFFSVKRISLRCLNGLGLLRELGPRDRVPGTRQRPKVGETAQ